MSEERFGSERLIAQINLDRFAEDSLTVSPDGRRVAYMAQVGKKWFVVVDGNEEKQYDHMIPGPRGSIVFDSADTLHYLATRLAGDRLDVYLAEQGLK